MRNRERRTIRYFGYGANASQEMMGAIIGRKPRSFVAQLEGYELWIQSWREIPLKVRKILSIHWNRDFKTYSISPKRGVMVSGRVWLLAPRERWLVSEWEFWYRPIKVKVRTRDGKLITVETETIRKPALTRRKRTNRERYKLFLNNKKRMLEVAEKVRESPLPKDRKEV